jgi:hypothetical protein
MIKGYFEDNGVEEKLLISMTVVNGGGTDRDTENGDITYL